MRAARRRAGNQTSLSQGWQNFFQCCRLAGCVPGCLPASACAPPVPEPPGRERTKHTPGAAASAGRAQRAAAPGAAQAAAAAGAAGQRRAPPAATPAGSAQPSSQAACSAAPRPLQPAARRPGCGPAPAGRAPGRRRSCGSSWQTAEQTPRRPQLTAGCSAAALAAPAHATHSGRHGGKARGRPTRFRTLQRCSAQGRGGCVTSAHKHHRHRCWPSHPPTHLQLAAGEEDEVQSLHHAARKPCILLFLQTDTQSFDFTQAAASVQQPGSCAQQLGSGPAAACRPRGSKGEQRQPTCSRRESSLYTRRPPSRWLSC